jgi:hypothetical protein
MHGHLISCNDVNGVNYGHIHVYGLTSDNVWTQFGSNMDGDVYDFLGWSFAMSSDGSCVAIGDKYIDGNVATFVMCTGIYLHWRVHCGRQ